MKTIKSKDGQLTWNVIEVSSKIEGKKKIRRSVFTVVCNECGYQTTNVKATIERRKRCPGCSDKPKALKTDKTGACISICEIGTVEFVRDYQEEHGVSEREAVRQFVDTVKANLTSEDPVNDSLTEESVRATVRRTTGKKKDKPQHRGESPQNDKSDLFKIEATAESVQQFLDEHLPDYHLTRKPFEKTFFFEPLELRNGE